MALQWLADVFCERDLRRTRQELRAASPAVRDYLARWKEHVPQLAKMLGGIRHLFLVGRGSSLAAVGTGALIVKESDHFLAEGMSSAAFRHGPFEMLSPETFVFVFSGEPKTRELNQRLFEDVRRVAGRAELVSEGAKLPSCALPTGPGPYIPSSRFCPCRWSPWLRPRKWGVNLAVLHWPQKSPRRSSRSCPAPCPETATWWPSSS